MGKEPDRLTMWDATHKKKDGRYVNEEFRKKLVSSLPYIILSLYYFISPLGIHEIIFMKLYHRKLLKY